MDDNPSRRRPTWYLEGAIDDSGQLFRIPVSRLPFRIGRQSGLELSLSSHAVSARHAELFERADRLLVRDLGSTNGTFLNKSPVEQESVLEEGDILQFATITFRLGLAETESVEPTATSTTTIDTHFPLVMAEGAHRLRQLLERGAVTQLFQPIAGLQRRHVLGYEVLGRGDFEGLPEDVTELFGLAEEIGMAVELSQALRRRSVSVCGALAGDHCYFLNTHPVELQSDALTDSLRRARSDWPDLRLAIEIHESAVTEPRSIRALREELERLEMLLVYDDFGAGQARLLELADVPPDFLKFDRSLLRDIDKAPAARQGLLEGLVRMALGLGIILIAEGIESREELEACRELGFAYGQGFLFALPRAAEEVGGQLVPPRFVLEG